MESSNIHDIDYVIAKVIQNDPYVLTGNISVTGLCKPPQMTSLELAHDDEITVDVSDELLMMLGRAVHRFLAGVNIPGIMQERTLITNAEGWIVSGTPDVWLPPDTLKDYKVTSVYSFLLGDKPDWEMQLNLYAALLRRHNVPVENLSIVAILRDWQKNRTHEDNYPKIPFVEKTIPLWDTEAANEVLHSRVKLHQAARLGDYPDCTPAERWARPDVWAVRKGGNKRAMRGGLFDSLEAAIVFADLQTGSTDIEHRPGQNTRCEDYCLVAKWCNQRTIQLVEHLRAQARE